MFTEGKVSEIFCILDEFCKYFTPELKNNTTRGIGCTLYFL